MPIRISIFVFCLFTSFHLFGQDTPIFDEQDGLVVIEAESALEYGQWRLDTTFSRHTGDGYLNFQGINYFNTPGISLLSYRIKINTPGTYRFQWRSRITFGDSNTEHNDSWLRFPDASDFFASLGNNIIIYPHGSGKTPNPEGSGSKGWFKAYQNSRGDWTWSTSTSDRNPHGIFVTFDTPGIYTLEVSGRSKHHAIDRMILFNETVSFINAQWLAQPESPRVFSVSTIAPSLYPLNIYPNPSDAEIFVQLEEGVSVDRLSIFDAVGRLWPVQWNSYGVANGKIVLPISSLPKGAYILQIEAKEKTFVGSFNKL